MPITRASRQTVRSWSDVAELRPRVDRFFDKVMVNAPDPKIRENRLSMLSDMLRKVFDRSPTSRRSSPQETKNEEIRLQLWRRHSRRRRQDERCSRRQRRRPRRDEPRRRARASRLHHLHRSLQHLLPERQQGSRRDRPADVRGAGQARSADRQEARRSRESAAGQRPLRREVLHARHDEHDSQPGLERRDRGRPGQEQRQSALRLRLLPPLHSDVRRSRARHRHGEVRPHLRCAQAQGQGQARHRSDAPKICKAIIDDYKKLVQKETKQAVPAGRARAARHVARRRVPLLVEPQGRATTARWKRSRTKSAPPPTCRPWCSATLGDTSATGVGFTRDPATGEKVFYGEFLVNAQGEDVVAGIRTPQPISDLEKVMPAAYKQLREITASLEKHYRDMQDFEFTIEDGKLYMLQTRNGKRTGPAAVRVAVEMVEEGMIIKKEAVLRVQPQQLDQLLHPVFDHAVAQEADADRQRHRRVARAPPWAAPSSRADEAVELAQERSRDSGPQRNHARRHSRHGRRQGHSDRGRRQVEPRRRGRARHGTALHRRRRRHRHRRARQAVHRHGRRQDRSSSKKATGFRSTAPPPTSIWARPGPTIPIPSRPTSASS